MADDPVRAAGAVVLRRPGGHAEVAVVRRDRYGDWSLPKGKLDPGELACEAAVREVAEETGLTVRLGVPLDRVQYRLAGNGSKIVDYWVGTVLAEEPRPPDKEISAVEWLPVDRAERRLSYDWDRAVLDQALAQPETVPLVVLRHAKAVRRRDWESGEASRPLTGYGERQAQRLVTLLDAYGIGAVHSSPWERCRRSVTPYANAKDLPVTAEPDLTEEAATARPRRHLDTWQRLREDAVAHRVPTVVCGHRPALPPALEALGVATRKVRTAEAVVVHLDGAGRTIAQEWQRPA